MLPKSYMSLFSLTSVQLVQSFKEIRVKASATLAEMSSELEKLAKAESQMDRQTAFVGYWKDVEASEVYPKILHREGVIDELSQFNAEYVSGVAKKVTEARSQILEGISKGAAKVSKTYTS